MNVMLDKKLCEEYPKIFVNRHGNMASTAMCWGFEHGDGWYNIINNLCRCIQHHIDSTNERRELLLKKIRIMLKFLILYHKLLLNK